VFFYCCGSVASAQAALWAPAWAPRSGTYGHVDNGASTPKATPVLYVAGAVGTTTAKTYVRAAKQRPSPQLFEGTSLRGAPYLCADELVIFAPAFCASTEFPSPAAAASRRRRQRSGHRPGHHDRVRATHSKRRLEKWPWHRGQVPASHKERRRGQRPSHHDQVPVRNNCHGQLPGHRDQVPAWRRGHRSKHYDKMPCSVFVRGTRASALSS
jgi:hypothetical protein